MQVTNSPLTILSGLMKARKWHQNKIEWRLAATYKNWVAKGKLSHEKASEILVLLGWEKIQEEIWKQK